MAEPDAAGPPPDGKADPRPKRSRPLSIAEAVRQMERQRAPLVAEIERAARERRWIDAEFGLEDSDAKASTAEPSPATEPVQAPAASPKPERWKPPASTDSEIAAGWAPYERRDAPPWLVERIREWWRPFEPGVVEHWIRLEREVKNLRRELGTDQRPHEEFHRARLMWSAEDLVDYMEESRMIPKRKRGPRGKTVCQRLCELHQNEPDFAEKASERKLAARIGLKSAGGLSKSHYWQTKLQPARAEIRVREALAKKGRKLNAASPSKAQARSENWGQREAVTRWGDVMDAVEILDRRLLELHREDPTFAETATENQVAQQIGGLPEDCLSKAPYWRDVLKPRRDALQAQSGDSAIDGGH